MSCEENTDSIEFVEVDPTGRYGRYSEILGRGASKTVYKGFDECEGIEVAWNQVKLHHFLQSPEDLERLYCEIHLLKTLSHRNIMKLYASWVDPANRNINFVTEMFTSGTLRQYRQKHRRVSIRAVKRWCRQILDGLVYLHSREPPVIHRDLKCDNIFVNGNQGEVKIGDLGLAAVLRKSHAERCVGTPEFMAPEVYREEYNELVDIYSFGMCVLEMVTFEYPYSECTHPVQIYKKVVSGTKPDALYRVEDPEVRQFVEKCLVAASIRRSARDLLNDPFLAVDDIYYTNGFGDEFDDRRIDMENSWHYDGAEEEPFVNLDITIKGRKTDDGGIFIRLRIADKDGHVRNIYFPFDVESDTALSVASEMVVELDITDYEVTRIAETIDSEVASLVPDWEPGPRIAEAPQCQCRCASDESSCGSLTDFLSHRAPSCGDLECSAMHGRFEEVAYQCEESQASRGDNRNLSDDNESEISQEPRWLKRDYKNRGMHLLPPNSRKGVRVESVGKDDSSAAGSRLQSIREKLMNTKGISEVYNTASRFYSSSTLLANSLARTRSLPLNAVELWRCESTWSNFKF